MCAHYRAVLTALGLLGLGLTAPLAPSVAAADIVTPRWDRGEDLTPFFKPLLYRLCFPLIRGGALDDAIAEGRNDGFARFGGDANQAMMRHDTVMLGLAPKSCTILLTAPQPVTFSLLTDRMELWAHDMVTSASGKLNPHNTRETQDNGLKGLRFRVLTIDGFSEAVEELDTKDGKQVRITFQMG